MFLRPSVVAYSFVCCAGDSRIFFKSPTHLKTQPDIRITERRRIKPDRQRERSKPGFVDSLIKPVASPSFFDPLSFQLPTDGPNSHSKVLRSSPEATIFKGFPWMGGGI